jgi:hypothetical protein
LSLKHSYTLVAPFYDAFLTAATRWFRLIRREKAWRLTARCVRR